MAREQFMVSVEFIIDKAAAAENAALGAWVRLNAYCAPRLLGGRIKGAKEWADGLCMRVLGMPRFSLDEIVTAGVAEWSGSDLVIVGYDLAGERIWKKKRDGGKAGGKASAAAYSSRTSLSESSATSFKESSEGVLQRDSDCDSVESPPGLSSDGERAREGVGCAATDPGQGGEAPPGGPGRGDGGRRFARRPALGRREASRRLPGRPQDRRDPEHEMGWRIRALTPPQIEAVFANAKRLTTHEIRYPSGFTKALEALRKERRAEQIKHDQAKAKQAQEQRREDERASARR
jgi:hypothetical protein